MWELRITPEDRLLVVSPHPDDESIGCGGLLLLYGAQTDVLLITDGRTAHGHDLSDDECATLRREEFVRATNCTKADNIMQLNVPDTKAFLCETKLNEIDLSKYTKVFVPNRAEENTDHRAVNECVRRALRRKHCRSELYEYEVWAPLAFPTHYLDISSVVQGKDDLISCYKSQLSLRDYHAMSRGLAAYRGVGCHIQYAEAYELISRKNQRKKWFYLLPVRIQAKIVCAIHRRRE